MPRPNTPPLAGPAWVARHQPTLAATWNATGVLRRPSTTAGAFDPATGRDGVTTPTAVWTGPLRLQQLAVGDGQVDFGEQQRSLSTARVTCPLTVTAQVDDRLTVTAATDTALVGTVWRVTAAATSSITWARDLLVEAVRG